MGASLDLEEQLDALATCAAALDAAVQKLADEVERARQVADAARDEGEGVDERANKVAVLEARAEAAQSELELRSLTLSLVARWRKPRGGGGARALAAVDQDVPFPAQLLVAHAASWRAKPFASALTE